MNLIRRHDLWDSDDLMENFRYEMNRLFHVPRFGKHEWKKTFEPEIDVVEKKDTILVKADLPGIKKEDLEIKVEGRTLTLKGERKEEKEIKEKNYRASERFYGAFMRMIELPANVKEDLAE